MTRGRDSWAGVHSKAHMSIVPANFRIHESLYFLHFSVRSGHSFAAGDAWGSRVDEGCFEKSFGTVSNGLHDTNCRTQTHTSNLLPNSILQPRAGVFFVRVFRV